MSNTKYDMNKYNLISIRLLKTITDQDIKIDKNGIIYMNSVPYKINDKIQLSFSKASKIFKKNNKGKEYEYLDFIRHYEELMTLFVDTFTGTSFSVKDQQLNTYRITFVTKKYEVTKNHIPKDELGMVIYRLINNYLEDEVYV